MHIKPRLVITGPTDSGKTDCVNALMARFPFEAINLDSFQVYAFFRVGPGRDDAPDRARRHLYGYLSPHDTLDPAAYVRSAAAVANEIELYGGIPVFDGGSRSLLPALAAAIPLKVFALRLHQDRAVRRERMRARIERRYLEGGLLREIEAAPRFGYGDCKILRDPLNYTHARAYLAGEISFEACTGAITDKMLEMQDSQLALFSQMPDVTWVGGEEEGPEQVLQRVAQWLDASGWLASHAR